MTALGFLDSNTLLYEGIEADVLFLPVTIGAKARGCILIASRGL
jgi:hypothetical protein